MNTEVNQPPAPAVTGNRLGSSAWLGSDAFPYFHSGNEKQDVACLLDMAIDIIEIWDVKNSPHNQELKRCWMKRAQELGANITW